MQDTPFLRACYQVRHAFDSINPFYKGRLSPSSMPLVIWENADKTNKKAGVSDDLS
jgi:hypothetical protein